MNYREAKIYITRLGWIFELSPLEAAAVLGQNNRIRYGYRRELRVEEFIPVQQCYKCCGFGHSAYNCKSEIEFCRFCGKQGHSGKDCFEKNDKKKWKCINCKWYNEAKGINLDVGHGAAQLHKCPVAKQQKEIRKAQLASAGVYTTPITEDLKLGEDMNQ